MKKVLLIASVAAALAAGPVAQAEGDAAAGQAKSVACAACHGADGNSELNPVWPRLAGQHASYIAKQLAGFKSGERKDTTMAPMAMPLSEQDMADLAAYFASQANKGGETAADKVELGQALYRAGNAKSGVAACTACHGPAGMGVPAANFPRLSGQNVDYIVKALKDFRSGARVTDPNAMMRNVAAKMSDAEIEAVAAYVRGLY